MDTSSILLQTPTYFSQNSPHDIQKEFIKKMYINIIQKSLFIYISLQLTYNNVFELFFISPFSSGTFVIIFYVIFISSALLYCNFNQIENYYDLKPYVYLLTFGYSYIFSYFTYYLRSNFFILNGNYLLTLFAIIYIYSSQNKYTFNYNTLIKLSFLSNILVFLILILFYSNFQYILTTYLTSSFIKLYIIYDTESIITSSNRKFTLKINEYDYGPIILYLDLFNIFPFIINLFTGRYN